MQSERGRFSVHNSRAAGTRRLPIIPNSLIDGSPYCGYVNLFYDGDMNGIGRRVQVRLPYNVQYASPIVVQAGENLTVGRADDDFPGWRWCTAVDGRQGWVPLEFLSSEEPQATILNDYSARELQVIPGEEVTVEDARHGWLLVRNMSGDCGWIPADRL